MARKKSADDFFNQASAFYRERNRAEKAGDNARAAKFDRLGRIATRRESAITESNSYKKKYNAIEDAYYNDYDTEDKRMDRMLRRKRELWEKKLSQTPQAKYARERRAQGLNGG